ncbi:hypothetical protein WMY93_010063 [Mugilogobius chulae]|uniref:Uncharacterized protein n=1 Tax=Mugilogobius chulae TaxID=88201 RepID=A0AAW0P9Z3_9GOBI
MCKNGSLRALVQERLTAAADEIFALFETTIAEFKEELRRSKEENQKKQELLEAVLNPSVVLFRESVQTQPTSPGAGLNPGLNQDLETPQTQIKEEPEEPRVKQEEEQRPIPECTAAACVKTESSSLLQQRQTELKEETQGEDFSTETPSHPKTERESSDTDNDDNWEPFSRSEAAGDNSQTCVGGLSRMHCCCLWRQKSSLLQQRQTELKEETQAEDLSTETHSPGTEENLLTLTMMTTGNHSAVQELLQTTTATPVSEVKAQQHKTLVCLSPTS